MRAAPFRFGNRVVVVAATVLVAAAMGGCGGGGVPPPGLQDIHSVADLEARFQADAGHPRLVMLLSPT